MTDALAEARAIVEAFPSWAFDRKHTEVLAKEVAVGIDASTAALREENERLAADLAEAEKVIAAERRALNIAYAELKRNERIGGFKKVTREVLDNIRVFVPDIDERNDELAAYHRHQSPK